MADFVKLTRRYQLQLPGMLYIGISIILGVGAINSQNNLLFIVFGVALAALVFSGVFSGAMLMGVSVERRPVKSVGAGQTFRVTYVVRNRNRFVPALALSITEQRPARRLASGVVGGGGGGGDRRGRRWTDHISVPLAFVPGVGGRSEVRVHSSVEAHHRGVTRLEGVVVSSSFPFGIFKKSIRFRQHEQILVLPATRPLGPGIFQSLFARAHLGEQSTSKRGRGDEFFGLRDYARGDSPRLIAWKASARSGNLVTRLTTDHASSFMRIMLLFDSDRPHTTARARRRDAHAHDPNELVITLAASLIDAAIARSMHVGLAMPQAGVWIEPGPSQRHRLHLLKALARIDAQTLEPPGSPPLGADAPNLVIAPSGRRHPLAPGDIPALDLDALSRWAIDARADDPRAEAGEPPKRGVA